ncbi:transcriptional regulator, Crp/Fnr family [hydrothermal vent metagenome]|uniref:Transcriptional regulator, Crp/Fnr family n=1 Tax=hydrothermal vent metagenome TaxID=652676 RepID=A0A1W1BBP6_9ZZZZ
MSIENQPILKKLNETTKLPIIKRQKRFFVNKGENPFDTERFFYFILSGKVKISQINFETSKEQILYLLSSGDMFDVTALLDGKSSEYLIEVLEKSEVVEVPISDVRELLSKEPSFQRFFFPYIAKQLRNMEELAVDLSLYDVYQRIIRLFARYVDQNTKNPKLGIIENLSHEELAMMVGSVRKVVNRALQKLKKDGIIDLSRKHIKLLDLDKLLQKIEY